MHHEESHAIKVSGNIELNEVQIAFKTAGRLIERKVDEGDPVEKGMIVARLDRDQLLRQRDRERAALASAEAMLAQAETAAEWQGQTVAADLDLRHADLSSAEVHLRELKNGARPQEIQEARAAVEAALAESERSARDWERAQTLYKNDDISTAQFDQFRTRAESATAALHQAQERSALIAAGPRTEVIDAASAQVARAQAGVKAGSANRLEVTRRFARDHRVGLALKGAGTAIGGPDGRVVVNSTGNPGMAKGGSGDVLTGIVGALLARGLDPVAALEAGCYLHGLAGDLTAAERGEIAMLAGDIVEKLPAALQALAGQTP